MTTRRNRDAACLNGNTLHSIRGGVGWGRVGWDGDTSEGEYAAVNDDYNNRKCTNMYRYIDKSNAYIP